MGEGAKRENDYRESANKKTLNKKTLARHFVSWRQTSKHVTSSFHKNWKRRFKNLKGWIQEVFLTYFSPRPLPYNFFFVQKLKRKKKQRKKTASYALSELQKPFNSLFLSFSAAPGENSYRQQQNSRRDAKWNVNNFVNDRGIFWCRWGSRGFYDCKENKYIKLWSKVQYQARREWGCDGCAHSPPLPSPLPTTGNRGPLFHWSAI